MSDPTCNEKGCGCSMLHVGWSQDDGHWFKVFCCYRDGKRQYIPWDHEPPR